MKHFYYKEPSIEVIEIEIEDAILNDSPHTVTIDVTIGSNDN